MSSLDALNDEDRQKLQEDVNAASTTNHSIFKEDQFLYSKLSIHQLSVLLYESCEEGRLDIVQHILKFHGRTNLHDKTSSKQMSPVNINYQNHKCMNKTPLHAACLKNHANIVQTLIEQEDIEVNCVEENQRTPLHLCCEVGSEEAMMALMQHPAVDVNVRDANGVSPFQVCMLNHRWVIANHLLLAGADVNLKRADGQTSLHICMASGDIEVLNFLLQLPEKHHLMFNARDEFGDTPLFKAVIHSGRTKAIRQLLTVGNNTVGTSIRNNVGENIFHLLSKSGNVNLLYFLVDVLPVYTATTAPNTLSSHRNKQSASYIEEDPEPLSPTLIMANPSPTRISFMERFNKSRRQSMFYGGSFDNTQQYVVDSKMQQLLNEKDKSGLTPLHVAVRFDHVDLVKALLALKAHQPPSELPDQEIPKGMVERRKSFKRLSNGILGNPHGPNSKLFDAVNVNLTDIKGNTPLHLAITAMSTQKARSIEIVRALLCVKGIKLDIKNCNNETAKQCAKKYNISLTK
jgi:ankyrin repeat protein